ncbi:Ribosome associated membrane protein RAMP4 containing protein [Hordeum vulgare]|nr:Ribosome associated membrane protein RAMP4 containing protein [Hordeum vulgare]
MPREESMNSDHHNLPKMPQETTSQMDGHQVPSDDTTSRRLADRKSAKFQKNITKRGSVPETTVKKGNDYPVGPIVLGFFIFVVIGSCELPI